MFNIRLLTEDKYPVVDTRQTVGGGFLSSYGGLWSLVAMKKHKHAMKDHKRALKKSLKGNKHALKEHKHAMKEHKRALKKSKKEHIRGLKHQMKQMKKNATTPDDFLAIKKFKKQLKDEWKGKGGCGKHHKKDDKVAGVETDVLLGNITMN